MKRPATTGARLRLCVWAIGSALSLGYYFLHAIRLPRRTEVGVECRLFGLSDLTPKLMESPSGGRWILVQKEGDLPRRIQGLSPILDVWERVRSSQWYTEADPYRQIAPFQVKGTWEVESGAPRRVWSWGERGSIGWLDDRHLWHSSEAGWPPGVWVLDLQRQRVREGDWSEVEALADQEKEQPYDDADGHDWDRDFTRTLSSPLEELPKDFCGGWQVEQHMGGQGLSLVHTWDASQEPVAAYAILDDPAPRVIRLARKAEPLALSHDGRTLFFRRSGALWRLDLRRPLPALLREVPAPDLPDPLAIDHEENPK
jgi:hypothetical protein